MIAITVIIILVLTLYAATKADERRDRRAHAALWNARLAKIHAAELK